MHGLDGGQVPVNRDDLDAAGFRVSEDARPTFYYTNGEPTGLAKQFLDFTISGGGQKVVAQVGFVPIP